MDNQLVIFDASKIISDSNGKGDNGKSKDLLRIMYHVMKKYNGSVIVVIDEGIIPQWKRNNCPTYKKYNSYFSDSRNMNPDSDDIKAREKFLEQIKIILEIFDNNDNIVVYKNEREELLKSLNKDPRNKIIVSDANDVKYLLSSKTNVYTPFGKVFVDYESYEKCVQNSIENLKFERNLLGDQNVKSCCKGTGPSNIKDFMLLINRNSENFKDEDDLKRRCLEIGIKQRSVYMNYNQNIFKLNKEIFEKDSLNIIIPEILEEFSENKFIQSIKDSNYFSNEDVEDIINNDVEYRLLWGR